MNPPYSDILKTAIEQHKIPNVIYIEEEEGWTIVETKTIQIPPPKTLHSLLIGLHEIGHIALEHPPRWGAPWEWTHPQVKEVLKEEQEAWKFALQEIDNYEMFIDIETLRACCDHYSNYIDEFL